MTKHLEREISNLKESIVSIGTIVEEAVYDAVKSVSEGDVSLAQKVIDRDHLINKREVQMEEECLKVLALHQPVAIDLRFIVAVFKINNDLERIGDLAANIAARAIALSKINAKRFLFEIESMTQTTKGMLKQSLDSLIRMDTEIARAVLKSDDIVDEANRENFRDAHQKIQEDPLVAEEVILMLSVSRNIERIADLATNIAEDVIYMIEGDIVRHKNKGG